MGFQYQTADFVAGTVLIIERVQSQNFVAGSFGWAIYANGDAEFNGVVVRGELLVGADPGQHIRVGPDGLNRPTLELSTGAPAEINPAIIQTSPPTSVNELELILTSPEHSGAPGLRPQIDLISWNASPSQIILRADDLRTFAPILLDTVWVAPALVPAWVDVAGARVGLVKDATGRVQFRGQVIGGAGAILFTIAGPAAGQPFSYRPTQTMEWVMRGVGGVVLCAVQVATSGVVTVTANLATATANGIRLDAISYPTI